MLNEFQLSTEKKLQLNGKQFYLITVKMQLLLLSIGSPVIGYPPPLM